MKKQGDGQHRPPVDYGAPRILGGDSSPRNSQSNLNHSEGSLQKGGFDSKIEGGRSHSAPLHRTGLSAKYAKRVAYDEEVASYYAKQNDFRIIVGILAVLLLIYASYKYIVASPKNSTEQEQMPKIKDRIEAPLKY
ncbi:MAG TPA: hypothetical protein PKD37_03200 [Oligoflexia bacterium]|nr:hypothetical protein [Oligoflexia bacterium]HMP26975.1 hypothetical protein [Oligoflexia bacterium]